MFGLDTKIQFIAGVGPKLAQKLEKLSISTVGDFLYHFPRRYDDYSKIIPIAELKKGELATIEAEITELFSERTSRRKMFVTSAMLEDGSGEISAVWFNQPYLAKVLQIGQKLLFRGKIEYNFQTEKKYLAAPRIETKKDLFPIYPETSGLTSKYLRKIGVAVLANDLPIEDLTPPEVTSRQHLLPLTEAIKKIHQPKNYDEAYQAKERLAFDELFNIILKFLVLKQQYQQESAPSIPIKEDFLKKFVLSLPFKLTNGQRKAAWEIITDLAKSNPMNRLLQGDVGSGKTVVAAIAAAAVIDGGYQVCWMAPTAILANQHFETISKIFKPLKYNVSILTGNKKTAAETDDIIIGTHALLHTKMNLSRLGLVVIDEQHRFGVKQRQNLRSRSDLVPHFLSLTATPIPRTLALSLYGDLEISIINELPLGRQKIETKIVKEKERVATYNFIGQQIRAGRQAFVICPLIQSNGEKDLEPSETALFKLVDEKKAVIAEYKKISEEIFPNFRVGLLHGKMKASEKDQVMADFSAGKLDILVSTAVVEVGIDVPNASVMMIEGAQYFGLAQLHQLRGRVGRGKHQSYCFLMPQEKSTEINQRLEALCSSDNGFDLAEMDLKLRGPGEFWGIRQSGIVDLKIASLSDSILVKRARGEAEIIAAKLHDYPRLEQEVKSYLSEHQLE